MMILTNKWLKTFLEGKKWKDEIKDYIDQKKKREMKNNILIVIPARMASKRLPGKPLVKIAGRELILRVTDISRTIVSNNENVDYCVATDDKEVLDFCQEHNISCKLTSDTCRSGTERCFDLVSKMSIKPDFIVNLQGDNPFCPPWFIEDLINAWKNDDKGQVFTPYVQLPWSELEILRRHKETTPFSGTFVITSPQDYAIAFSKNIIPAIRKEEKLKTIGGISPVKRHIGLYAYTYKGLKLYMELPSGVYEKLEGLEQMRFIENQIPVKMVGVDYKGHPQMSGIDSPEDVKRAEELIKG